MRNKITLLLVVTLAYECHSGLIKDILLNHRLGTHGSKRQSINQGEPGTVILVVKEGENGYGKPGYGGPGHYHHGNGYQQRYAQSQGERPEYFEQNQKPGYGGLYSQNKPGYGGNQQNPVAPVPPNYGIDRPNYGHRPGYGGHRPSYGVHRPGFGNYGFDSNSASSEESSEELFGYQPAFGFRPPYNQGSNFNPNQQTGTVYRPGVNNPNGPIQPGSVSGQYGNNNRPSFNQIKPVYENPIVQPNIQELPVQQPNINQQPLNGPFQPNINNQGGIKPNPADINNVVLPIKPQSPDGDPLFVPLDPTAELNQNGEAIKRETNEKPKPEAGDDEEYGIDVRYGDK